jgi:hypothetical protein
LQGLAPMKLYLGLTILAALVLGLAGCNSDADKGIIQHKEKPVHPAPQKPADGEKK